MKKSFTEAAIAVYGVAVYLYCLRIFVGLLFFTYSGPKPDALKIMFPYNVNGIERADLMTSLMMNTLLLSSFCLQHTIMARDWFKEKYTAMFPASSERSSYILASTLVANAFMNFWHPIMHVIWYVPHPYSYGMYSMWALGSVLVLAATFNIDHFELFGLRQCINYEHYRAHSTGAFAADYAYKYMRHPMMTGFLLALWFTPLMTVGQAFLAMLLTTYIFVEVMKFEEPDLVRKLGDTYVQYKEEVPAFCPMPGKYYKGATKSRTD